jgi:zinc transporter ZupT
MWSTSCKHNPKVLGVANAFTAGVFVAIAFVHILPEQVLAYNEYKQRENPDVDLTDVYLFPVPELCLFCGYTLILTVDKVFFDAHGLLAGAGEGDEELQDGEIKLDDPSDNRFVNEVLDLMAQSEKMSSEGMENQAIKKIIAQQLTFSMKNYLDKGERMVTRMQANIERRNSLGKKNSLEKRPESAGARSNSIHLKR